MQRHQTRQVGKHRCPGTWARVAPAGDYMILQYSIFLPPIWVRPLNSIFLAGSSSVLLPVPVFSPSPSSSFSPALGSQQDLT